MAKKITLTTFKSFMKKNAGNVLINQSASFDGMTDCIERVGDGSFSKLKPTIYQNKNNMGFQKIWLVFQSRDYFQPFETDDLTGIKCINCCGTFTVAIPKQ